MYPKRKNKKSIMLGWAVCRISREPDRTHGSLEQQNNAIETWLKRQSSFTGSEYRVLKYIEEDISGRGEYLSRRKDLLKLESMIESGAIDFVVFERLDRLARNETFNKQLVEKAHKAGVEIHEVNSGEIDLRDRGRRWAFKIKNIQAEEYSHEVQENVWRKQRQSMVHNGKDPSPFPVLGLDKDKVYAGFYEPDLEELKIPIDIMKFFANHKGDRAATIRYTIEKGYRSKEWMTERKIDRFGMIHSPRKIGGDIFDWDKLIRLLANPKYRGVNYFVDVFDQYPDIQDANGIVRWEYSHRRKYGDIIDPKLLEEVDQYLEPPKTRPRQNDYFLAGILLGPDGSKYFAEEAKSGEHPYYYNRKVRKRFPREHIHQLVFEKLKEYLVDFGIIERLIKSMAKEKEFGMPKLQEQRKEINIKLGHLERAKSNFSEIIKKAAVANDDKLVEVVNSLLEEKRRSEGEIVELTHRLKELDVEEQQFLKNLDGSSLKHFLELTLSNFDQLGAVERKQVVQALIPKAEIHIEDSGEILLKLFISLNPTQESSLHDPKLRAQEDKSWPFIKNGRGDWI